MNKNVQSLVLKTVRRPRLIGEKKKLQRHPALVHAQLCCTDLCLEEAFVPGGESFSTGMPLNP